MSELIDCVVDAMLSQHRADRRLLVAVAGPPATGKTTFCETLIATLNTRKDITAEACVVPMDGFHLDNRQLQSLGLSARKGAPPTFDYDGLYCLLNRTRTQRSPIYYPLFDRERDLAIAAAGVVRPETEMVVVEGNYLMLNQEPWRRLAPLFDLEIFLDAPLTCLEDRLIQRWLDHGLERGDAEFRARANDIPNAELVLKNIRTSENAFKAQVTQSEFLRF
ncbi:MAG: nucleoside/nucleotide kinase family protein [Roseibium sp.]|uniref:nucleoside/nucleotide kinase family protein n=1 Tax=Roseibium sp. TaxID=1936156 RepID=UPI0026225714|nr:nucleoside/nucleotide kinase family protein [Roseibium sp.]MCV0426621.1 nucleoside/nucleotide kinase family protein [Roseibium sp.]